MTFDLRNELFSHSFSACRTFETNGQKMTEMVKSLETFKLQKFIVYRKIRLTKVENHT